MARVHLALGALFVLLPACTGHAAPQSSGSSEPPSEPGDSTYASDASAEDAAWDVREAVFRHQFEDNASGQQQSVAYYFLALGNPTEREDPPPEFLKRFEGHTPKVVPVSQSTAADNSAVIHQDDGKRGLIFQITNLQWIDETTAEVQGGYYEGNVSASGNLYRVEKRGDEWVVTDDRVMWMS